MSAEGNADDPPGGLNPAALILQQMGQSWKASLGMWSAWRTHGARSRRTARRLPPRW